MIEPTMKAIPERKNQRSNSSTAATMLSTKPVSEIVFGVSRDSISRCWTIWEVGRASRSPRWRLRGARGGRTRGEGCAICG